MQSAIRVIRNYHKAISISGVQNIGRMKRGPDQSLGKSSGWDLKRASNSKKEKLFEQEPVVYRAERRPRVRRKKNGKRVMTFSEIYVFAGGFCGGGGGGGGGG